VPIYSVHSLDVVGNPVDGYEVNDSRALREVYIPASLDSEFAIDGQDRNVCEALIANGTLDPAAREERLAGSLNFEYGGPGEPITVTLNESAFAYMNREEETGDQFIAMVPSAPRERARVRAQAEQNVPNADWEVDEVTNNRPILSLTPQELISDTDADLFVDKGVFWQTTLHFGPRFVGDSDTVKVAIAFSRILRERLTPEEMRQVVERNRAEADRNICHSQDFADANMVMNDAFEEVMDRGFDYGGDEADEEIWSAAWEMAKTYDFEAPYSLQVNVGYHDGWIGIVVSGPDASDRFEWPLQDWPHTFGFDPLTSEEIRPAKKQLAEILVALDQALERS